MFDTDINLEIHLPASVLSVWRHTVATPTQMLILPDGCRDLIIKTSADGNSTCLISALDDTPRTVNSNTGDRYLGWRLHPGACVETSHFSSHVLTQLQKNTALESRHIFSMMDDLIQVDPRLTEALDGLKNHRSIPNAARDLGISERSLQRWLTKRSGRPPTYWRGLARARQAAQALFVRAAPDIKNSNSQNSLRQYTASLAELAADFTFSDQAHLCREFQRWFGCSPSAMLQSKIYQELIMADGYA